MEIMNKAKLAIGVFLIFLVGACAGSLGGVVYLKYLEIHSEASDVESRYGTLLRRLSDRLDLTESQQDEVDKIIRIARKETIDVMRNYLPEIEAVTERSLMAIKQELDADQSQKLDELYQKVRGLHNKSALELVLSDNTVDSKLYLIADLLNLTPGQEEKVQEILEEYLNKRREIINQYYEQGNTDFSPLRFQIISLGDSTEMRLADVLSKDQMKIYEEAGDRN